MLLPRPKYSLPERERRWLVAAGTAPSLCHGEPSRILDRYVDGSRLRLRRITGPDGVTVYKLCRKYGDRPPGAESITNLYLSAEEHALLGRLPGWVVEKNRYRCQGGSLDCYRNDGDTLYVYERGFAGPASAADFPTPAFVTREITADPLLSGAALARRFGCRDDDGSRP